MENSKVWVDHIIDTPEACLGPRASYTWKNDPKRLVFTLARYKFTSKMLSAKRTILEVGCGDAFGAPIVAKDKEQLFCVDSNDLLLRSNAVRLKEFSNISFKKIDIVNECIEGMFDGAFSLDVLEHIPRGLEHKYFENICKALDPDGIFVMGMPSLASEPFASKPGSSPHINLKDESMIRESMGVYFKNVLIFSMNDEIVHTGFTPLAHYLFGVGIGLK